MGVLSELEPKEVFRYFEEISQIPRPSYQEKAISDYLVKFAEEQHLEHYQDKRYNVIIIKEATPGYEAEEPVILQGHMDMVCETEPGCTKDMEKEGLELFVDGDFVKARGTTLGGDDGVAVAFALAILSANTLAHPRLEFICTVSEEVGMDGAHAIDVSMLKGHKLLNLDSEEEGTVLASCAGGGNVKVRLTAEREAAEGAHLTLTVTGLTGGHSGVEINKGRANASQLMARILTSLQKQFPLRLVSMAGGSKDNAITRECKAELLLAAAADAAAVREAVKALETTLRKEYAVVDPELTVRAETGKAKNDLAPLTQEATKKAVSLLLALPNGVQRMSDDIAGLVETSLNVGVARLEEKELMLSYAVRSSVSTAFTALTEKMEAISEAFGAKVEISAVYPAWEYVRESALREDMSRIYQEMFGEALKIEAIHAGVECGILAGKIPGLDAVSMGPNIIDIHTPAERLSISSTKRMYEYVVKLLACRK